METTQVVRKGLAFKTVSGEPSPAVLVPRPGGGFYVKLSIPYDADEIIVFVAGPHGDDFSLMYAGESHTFPSTDPTEGWWFGSTSRMAGGRPYLPPAIKYHIMWCSTSYGFVDEVFPAVSETFSAEELDSYFNTLSEDDDGFLAQAVEIWNE